ncbi:MAG: UbiA family prenyltransferase [Anaerolineales bacterium]
MNKNDAQQSQSQAPTHIISLTEADLRQYILIARPDHWFKNLLALPGFVLAALLTSTEALSRLHVLLCGGLAMCLISSANYVINEWVDRETDGHHPEKNTRPLACGLLEGRLVAIEYALLAVVGLLLSTLASSSFLIISLLFLVQGLIYNVRPMRSKDRPYWDVLSESINNPLRFWWGWFVVTARPLPPISVILAYWLAGAYMMTLKRYAEYRSIGDPTTAALYRASFQHYTEQRLLTLAVFSGVFSTFLLGLFITQYSIKLSLSFPFLSLIFAEYFRLSLEPASAAQSPERLYQERRLMALIALTVIVVVILLNVDLPHVGTTLSAIFPTQAPW